MNYSHKHSHSSISTYFRCPQEYKLKYVDKRVPIDDYSPDAEFGTLFHSHLENNTFPEWSDYRMVRMHVLLTGYRFIYKDDPPNLRREVEWTYQDELGIFDGVADNYLLEEKTTKSTIGEFYWNRKVLDSQVSLYLWAARGLGMNIDYLKYRVTRHAQKKPSRGESFDDYNDRYTRHVQQYQDGIFCNDEFRRTEEQLEAFERSRAAAKHLIGHSIASGNFPHNTGSCFQFNKFCGYLPVCAGETTINDDGLYQVRKRRK